MAVLRNVITSEGRRRSVVGFDSTIPEPRAAGASASTVAELREDSRYARDRLRVLSERDRCLVELRVLEGLPFSEVAARLGLKSEAHARVVFQRSLQRLRSPADDEQRSR
jgi:DNA-directed RNA polymerase specialized sigma24 family protein